MQKKIIFTADDFGKCPEMDKAILKAYQAGVLNNTCIMMNGENCDNAINEILPQCADIGMGCHLNIIEGKSLLNKNSSSMLCDADGNYNKGFIYMFIKSHDKKFMAEVEVEFRSQIEACLGRLKIDHINSHVHVHGIPKIFELTCKLAEEYGIFAIRTQGEIPYFATASKYSGMGFVSVGVNAAKNVLLNLFTFVNKVTAKKYDLKTNDNFIGLLFTAHMDKEVIIRGLKSVKEDSVTEVLVHPYLNSEDKNKINEYLLTQDVSLKNEIENAGFGFCKFHDLP